MPAGRSSDPNASVRPSALPHRCGEPGPGPRRNPDLISALVSEADRQHDGADRAGEEGCVEHRAIAGSEQRSEDEEDRCRYDRLGRTPQPEGGPVCQRCAPPQCCTGGDHETALWLDGSLLVGEGVPRRIEIGPRRSGSFATG